MTITKFVGEDVDFEFTVLDSEGAAADLQGATVQFAVRRKGELENLIDRTPTITGNVVTDSLTSAETIVLTAGNYIWEFKVAMDGDVKKYQGKLNLYSSITD